MANFMRNKKDERYFLISLTGEDLWRHKDNPLYLST